MRLGGLELRKLRNISTEEDILSVLRGNRQKGIEKVMSSIRTKIETCNVEVPREMCGSVRGRRTQRLLAVKIKANCLK